MAWGKSQICYMGRVARFGFDIRQTAAQNHQGIRHQSLLAGDFNGGYFPFRLFLLDIFQSRRYADGSSNHREIVLFL